MFYDLYCELCEDKGITASGAAAAIGFNRATVTSWKNSGKAPKGELLSKIAKFFDVPVDFLLQRPPFDFWNQINADRRGFILAAGFDSVKLKIIWNLDPLNPYAIPLKDFVNFLSVEFLSAVPVEEGKWDIKLRADHVGIKKAPTPEGEREDSNLQKILSDMRTGKGPQAGYVIGMGGGGEVLELSESEFETMKQILKTLRESK